ncbi:unnamed protein product [Penicillium olsonii]|uniref:Uncharacterized protein n=1 Tax=Penicillium olsonii TaxID=99116 RepID=A0A9W4HXR4_PENOL|nr:unnamed protein product [Penicillium olsonii]CAG8254496.1 unnamed protein product [Penicillium olsonii]
MSGWPSGWAFCVGLLQAAYATSSTGMIISMCDEVRDPQVQVPQAMIGTILLNTVAGLLFLIPAVVVLPDMVLLINEASGQPVPVIIKSAVGNTIGTFFLLIPLIALALFCGIACTTTASRCTWAFAHDGGIPGVKWWGPVHPHLKIPLNAMGLSMATQIALGSIYFGSETAFNAFSSAGVIFSTVSYAIPIAASLFGGRTDVKQGKFSLGRFGMFCNIVSLCMSCGPSGRSFFPGLYVISYIALGWSVFAVPLFCMPSYLPVAPQTINYAFAVFAGLTVIAILWYYIWGYKNFQGPRTGVLSASPMDEVHSIRG